MATYVSADGKALYSQNISRHPCLPAPPYGACLLTFIPAAFLVKSTAVRRLTPAGLEALPPADGLPPPPPPWRRPMVGDAGAGSAPQPPPSVPSRLSPPEEPPTPAGAPLTCERRPLGRPRFPGTARRPAPTAF